MYPQDFQVVGNFTFKREYNCKYLGVYINQQTNSLKEINDIK